MIALECAGLKGFLECASLSVSEGKICALLTEADFEKNLLIKILAGLARLDSGKVFIFGRDTSSMSYADLNELRKKMGIVFNNGGLVSNLKVWENVMLPLDYHRILTNKNNTEGKVVNFLRAIGYDDDLNMLPGPLPTYKKRLVGFVRTMLMEPDLIIYDSVLDGLSPVIKEKVVQAIYAFHNEKGGRTSIFIDSNERFINDIKTDKIYLLKNGKFYERD